MYKREIKKILKFELERGKDDYEKVKLDKNPQVVELANWVKGKIDFIDDLLQIIDKDVSLDWWKEVKLYNYVERNSKVNK